jgi:hypothetical protein
MTHAEDVLWQRLRRQLSGVGGCRSDLGNPIFSEDDTLRQELDVIGSIRQYVCAASRALVASRCMRRRAIQLVAVPIRRMLRDHRKD